MDSLNLKEKEFALFCINEGDMIKAGGVKCKVVSKDNGQLVLEPTDPPWYFMRHDLEGTLHKVFIDDFDKYKDMKFKP